MPTVPSNVDPGQLEALTGGAVQPEPQHMLMAAADMHNRGRLIASEDQSSTRTGASKKLLNFGSLRRRRK